MTMLWMSQMLNATRITHPESAVLQDRGHDGPSAAGRGEPP
jgi:hypothetical protein